MYSKIALRNVKKSYKDYFIYFITLTFSVALFYIFGSFEQQSSILNMTAGQGQAVQALVTTMNVMSAIISVVFAFLILYANNFLIRRRKKELGIYTILGMPKRILSRILIYETLYIGIVSLVSGLILGYIGSQLTAIMSAKVLDASVSYHFVFSMKATIKTVVSFAFIFVIVMFFNGRVLNKISLIDLLRAERKNETSNAKHAVLIFISGVILLVIAYLWALKPLHLIIFMPLIIALGSFATFTIFKSFAGFMLKFTQVNIRIYFKNLNLFVFRQVASKVNTTYKMMSVVSLLLLFGIATLATGFNLNSVMGEQVKRNTPFDYSLVVASQSTHRDEDLEFFLGQQDRDAYASMNIYNTEFESDVIDSLFKNQEAASNRFHPRLYLADISDYNAIRAMHQLGSISLNDDYVYIYGQDQKSDTMRLNYKTDLDYSKQLNLGSKALTAVDGSDVTDVSLKNGDFGDTVIFMNTATLQSVTRETSNPVTMSTIHNFNQADALEFKASVDQELIHLGYDLDDVISIASQELYESLLGIELVFTYIGLYLGVVFLISSGVILALQQLSEANDNQQRYRVLSKIGASDVMMDQSIFKQNALYFFIPLAIALIHSYIGIRAVNINLDLMGLKATSLIPTILTVSGVLIIYLIYFIATYKGSKSIIKGN